MPITNPQTISGQQSPSGPTTSPLATNQFNGLLGTPSLHSVSSPFVNSSYAPSSSFFIPSSIPAQQQQQGAGGGVSPQQMLMARALAGR